MMNRLSLSPRLRVLLRRGMIATAAVVLVALSGMIGLIASRDYAAIEREVISRIEKETGASLRFESRRQVLWPKPKIVFEKLVLSSAGQDLVVRAPQAILNFDLTDLLDGTIDGPVITLLQPEIEIVGGPLEAHLRSPRAITGLIDRIAGMFDTSSGFSRLRLSIQQAKIRFRNPVPGGEIIDLAQVEGRLRFSASRGRIDLYARQESTFHPLELSASLPTRLALVRDKAQPASIHISGYESRLVFGGTARRDPDIALMGRLEVSVGDAFERTILGERRDRREAKLDATSLAASMTLDPRGVGLESLKITQNSRHLSGIAALREINGRWGVSATLAGDLVDGSGAQAAFEALRMADGTWSAKPLTIVLLPGIDLDIRLSTREFKLGNVLLNNVALSILTRHGRAELAVVDSRFGDGTIKARVSLAGAADGTQELRLQASGERVDAGRLLEKALGFNRLSGDGNMVIQAEGRGKSIAAIVASLAGTGALEVRGGELVGIDLSRLLARSGDQRPAEASLIFALAGKTPFEILRANFALKDGRIEPVGSTFATPRVTAMLEGGIDLPAQRHQMAIVLKRRVDEAGLPGEFYAFRLDGPLFAPSLKPDLKLLLNRS
jgi:hypothetical protein